VVQIFDSWASELAPQDFGVFSKPYIYQIIQSVRKTHPNLQLILYISNSGGLMERMAACEPDIISVDQRVDMRDAIARIGPKCAVQVCQAVHLSLWKYIPDQFWLSLTFSWLILPTPYFFASGWSFAGVQHCRFLDYVTSYSRKTRPCVHSLLVCLM
jgi:hypothetical protein